MNGTFIDYLVLTENLTIKQAINKFKYEILGLSKEEEKQQYINNDGGVAEDLSLVINQLDDVKLQTDYIKELSWLEYFIGKNGELVRKVSCPKLAQFIRQNLHFIFVRDNAKSGINRYFYIDGYYKLVNDKYGHNSGDMVLKEIAKILKSHNKKIIPSRWGGEEFVVISTTEVPYAEFKKLMESIRVKISKHKFEIVDKKI